MVESQQQPGSMEFDQNGAQMQAEFNDDNDTQQTLEFLNEMQMEEQEEEKQESAQQQQSNQDDAGLKVTTFGAMFRESEAKKNVLALPSLMTVLEQVKFELQTLPDGLEEAFAQCQQTKELILQSYLRQLEQHLQGQSSGDATSIADETTQRVAGIAGEANRKVLGLANTTFLEMYERKLSRKASIVTQQQDLAPGVSTERSQSISSNIEQEKQMGRKQMMMKQAHKYENMVNSCLLERLAEEERFAPILRLHGLVWTKSDEIFNRTFDRTKIQQLIAMSESAEQQSSLENTFNLENLIKNFWMSLEDRFLTKYLSENIVNLFHQEVETFPEFFISHYKYKIAKKLINQINQFKLNFVTATEEEWIVFINSEKKKLYNNPNQLAYKPQKCNMDILKALLQIMTVMPIKQEIKHEWHVTETKIKRLQKGWGINPPIPCLWQISPEDLQVRVDFLQRKLKAAADDFVIGVQRLHEVIFTILNGFVNFKHYDSKDRTVIKLTFEACHLVFQKILKVKEDVSTGFFLTMFEMAFGSKSQRDKYDIKLMHRLFGDELLRTLQIETSIQRCNVLQLDKVSDSELKSKHIVICVSGFLQELEDNKETWKNVVTFFKHAEVFALKWTACNSLDLFDAGVFKGKKKSGVKKFLNVINVFSTGQKQFIFAYDQARLSGSLLAIFLLKSNLCDGKAVTLIGFSLGSVVAMHCIRILKYMYRRGFVKAGSILHDVQLWAGAFVIDPQKTHAERMRSAYHCSIINGKFWNLWSAKDAVVRIMQPLMQPGTVSIGVKPIQEDIEDDDDGSKGCRKPINLDVSETGGNHNHIAGCKDFLPTIPFAY